MKRLVILASSLFFLFGCSEERVVVRDDVSTPRAVEVDETRERATNTSLNVALNRINALEADGRLLNDPFLRSRADFALSRVVAFFSDPLARTDVYLFESKSGDAEAFTYGTRSLLLSRQMVEQMTGEGELEFVIAHELAHIEAQHNLVRDAVRKFERNRQRADTTEIQARVNEMSLSGMFRRVFLQQEFLADRLALQRLRDASFSPCKGGALSALNKLYRFYPRTGYGELLTSYRGQIEMWDQKGLPVHPALTRRVAELVKSVQTVCSAPVKERGE